MIKMLRRKVSVGGKYQTWEELIIEGQIKAAIKGNTQAAQFLFDRAYGRVVPTEAEPFTQIRVIVQRNTVRFPEMELPEVKGTLQ